MAHTILAGPCNGESYDIESALRIPFNARCMFPVDMSIDMFVAFLRPSLFLFADGAL